MLVRRAVLSAGGPDRMAADPWGKSRPAVLRGVGPNYPCHVRRVDLRRRYDQWWWWTARGGPLVAALALRAKWLTWERSGFPSYDATPLISTRPAAAGSERQRGGRARGRFDRPPPAREPRDRVWLDLLSGSRR